MKRSVTKKNEEKLKLYLAKISKNGNPNIKPGQGQVKKPRPKP